MIPSGGTTSSITYTLKEGCESATVTATTDNPSMITAISVGNGKINFTVTKNQSTSKREGFIYPSVNGTSCDSKKIKVEQAAGEAPTTCGCGNFKINTESLTWESANKEGQNIKITESGNCISNVTPTLKSDSHFTVTINGDTITVTPKDTTTTSKIEETLTISYKANGTECTPAKTVSLKHKSSACDCDSFSADTIPNEIKFDNLQETSSAASIYNYSGGTCITLDVENSNTANFAVTATNGKITIYPKSQNTDANPRTANIKIKVMNNGVECTDKSITFTITQISCNCDFSADTIPSEIEFEADEYGENVAKTYSYSGGSCLAVTPSGTPQGWENDFVVTTTRLDEHHHEGTITIYPKGENTSTSNDRTANIKIKVSLGIECVGKSITFKLKQKHKTECTKTIKPTEGNINGDCSGGTVTFEAT